MTASSALEAVPTTAGTGSETTLAAVITDAQTRYKYAINDFPLIPKYAVLDPKVTVSLPPFITATTGMLLTMPDVPLQNLTLDMYTVSYTHLLSLHREANLSLRISYRTS